ncbi:DUF6461 domain-containing protein [Streptomyces sp. NPDC051940]|uniref:DUF6461 domain-containing protein n=1 Tax=Streptomyces sp. NPDC051940 TaxID=3155675 RepID=UPI003433A660
MPGKPEWDELVTQYAWVDTAEDLHTYTISVITGKDEDEVIRAFGGDPGVSRLMTFDQTAYEIAEHPSRDHALLRVLTAGKHVVAMEWGYHGSIPEIARRASAHSGEFFSIYASINARYQVMHARDGLVDGAFDPLDMEDAAFMDPPPTLPTWAQDVAFHMETHEAESFALMHRTMGLAFDPDWLDVRARTVLLPAPGTLFSNPHAAWRL